MSFRDIVGHDKQIAELKGAMAKQRIPHAYLFYGLEGVGKRTTALAFAKTLNCLKSDLDACQVCASCRKADHNNHLDIVLLAAEGQFIKIQAIRELQERMKFKPWEGKKRVTIIDGAERMNEAAANALLKTLEEPPPANILILVSARPSQLPATILSRCRQVRFHPLGEGEVASFLQKSFALDPALASLLANSSGGSLARALALQKQSYVTLRDEMLDMLTSGQMLDPLGRLSQVGRFGKDREDVLERLDVLRVCYRDALVYRETGETTGLINQDRAEVLRPFVQRLSTQDMLGNIKVLDRAAQALEQHADKTLTLEVMMFRLKW